MVIKCQICGEENKDSNKYCAACGGALGKIDISAADVIIRHTTPAETDVDNDEMMFTSQSGKKTLTRKIGRKKDKAGSAEATAAGLERLRIKSKTWEEMTPEEVVVRKKTHYVMIFWIMIGIVALTFIAQYIVFI